MKKIFLYISFLFFTTSLFAQAKIGSEGNVIPTGNYPVVHGRDVKGALHFFQTITDRNNLPANFRDTGMLAYVYDSLKYYSLKNGVDNSDWVEFQGGSGGNYDSAYNNLVQAADSSYLGIKDFAGRVDTIEVYGGAGGSGSGGIESVVAGDNIEVDDTDPSNPIVSAVLSSVGASNGLTKVGNDIQLGGSLKTGYTFLFGQSDTSSNVVMANLHGFAVTTLQSNPLGMPGVAKSNITVGGNLNIMSEYDSIDGGGNVASSESSLLTKLNNAQIRAGSGFYPYTSDPSLPLGSSLNVYPDGIYIATNNKNGSIDSGATKPTIFHILVDSSSIPNLNNIAYFDNDTLKRGSLSVSGTTPALQDVTDVGYITTNPIIASSFGALSDGTTNVTVFAGESSNNQIRLNYAPSGAGLALTYYTSDATLDLKADNVDGTDKVLQLPNTNGTLVATVNGVAVDVNGNVNTRLQSYTVATLPSSPTQGDEAAVTDATSPAYLEEVTGGGSTYAPVVFNGTIWVCH